MKWTEEQQKVIDLRDRNILVSAAAGSGKTAVLVERILSRLQDRQHPVDIDRMLIMTFTRAAAGEMKLRLSRALDQALSEDPENEHLQRQSSLVHNAQITTIDGFCAYILRNYFHLIDLDPGFRAVDEGEGKLLRTDVVREVLEEAHAQGDPAFLRLADGYAPGRTDAGLETMILRLYDFAGSAPWPRQWLEDCLTPYRAETVEEITGSSWFSVLWEDVEKHLQDLQRMAERNLELTRVEGGPYAYESAALSDLGIVSELQNFCGVRDFDGMTAFLAPLKHEVLSRKKMETVDEEKKAAFKSARDVIKEEIRSLKEDCFAFSLEETLEMLRQCREPAEKLVSLTLRFSERYREKKRQKNLIDFGDMEHLALEILVRRDEDGTLHPTEASRELSEKYEEVLVDEYQDSNLVQETLTAWVSGWVQEKKNIFMVGDVKQSIYRFRLARPELFMEKYHTYSLGDSPEQRVDLSRNFRSRREVLTAVNYIFRKIMGRSLGGVEYDSAAALYYGASYPEYPDAESGDFPVTEVLIVEKDGDELSEEQEKEERQLEALTIAGRIREIVGREPVYDRELGGYRPAEYRDIVILLRTLAGWADEFAAVLEEQGIPAYTASRTGYFSALEVATVLNYLRISDNFQQEIPLASVLRSPFAGLSAEEMALLKVCCPDRKLYEQVRECLAETVPGETEAGKVSQAETVSGETIFREEAGDAPRGYRKAEELGEETVFRSLYRKLTVFRERLEEFRSRVPYTPIHQLILHLLRTSGYQEYVSAMPGGEQRKANLDMLVEKAMEYEKTSYRGLFNFVRYVETLQKYEVDFGEVNLSGGQEAVQIMSIHKSKGLEFPIVFASGMGKAINMQDLNAGMLVHAELGIGLDTVDLAYRTRVAPLMKQVIRKKLKEESLGEELRILYVAMTRAREKLIFTGTLGQVEDKICAVHETVREGGEKLSFSRLLKARRYWDWILEALARHSAMEELYHRYDLSGDLTSEHYDYWKDGSDPEKVSRFRVRLVTAAQLLSDQVEKQVESGIRKEQLQQWDGTEVSDPQLHGEIEKRFSYRYPYADLEELPVKLSVSEIKKGRYHPEEEQEEAMELFEEDGGGLPEEIIPGFIRERETVSAGASRGTAYHKVFECLDYRNAGSEEAIRQQLETLLLENLLDAPGFEAVSPADLTKFLSTELGQRMKAAALRGTLRREQPFVIRKPACEIRPEWTEDRSVLIQGIIDAFFAEGEELVLVDYKTDRIFREERLLELYGVQLELYAEALERLTGRRVKEKILYSVTMGKAIPVPEKKHE